MSSRDDEDITHELSDVPNLYITAKENSRDIQRFITREVGQAIKKRRLLGGDVSVDLQQRIECTLVEKARGM